MKASENTNLLLLLLAALFLSAFPALAQDPKQELNDQLFEAARKGDAAAVAALLDKGADVNAKFRYGTTALFKAAERGNIEVVKVLLARGADVSVKDTFYGATAMTWALDNDHVEVVRALLEKSPDSAGEVLLTGVREGKVEFVRAALDRGGLKAETLTSALASAMTGDSKNDEISALLKKAGAVPPPEVDAATLQSYVGKYKGEPGPEVSITLTENRLFAVVTGQRPFALIAVDTTTFRPAAFDGITITFKIEAGKTAGFTLKQGETTTQLKRVDQ
ncbi:MAG TPA: ankyrin repeat domain-containing protein [Pyrinomonadaceae bacterium]|nr:ankyrin repeat domain-containing protein [Pyrinomonadaceae bacterium]